MTTAVNTIGQLQKQFEMISNNIANAQTNGFKKRDASFTDMLYQQVNNQPIAEKEQGRLTPHGLRQGIGAQLTQSMMISQQGAIQTTDRSLDFAFTKEKQFLKVAVQENGQAALRLTRDGALYLTPAENNQMRLVTSAGNAVLDENNQPITFSDQFKTFQILDGGVLQATGNNGEQISVNLGVVEMKKPQFLEQKGGNLLGLPDNLQPEVDQAEVYTELLGVNRNQIAMKHNALEASNVDLGKEMTDMTSVQRALQFQSRAISMSDQMMGLVNSIR